MKYCRFQLNGEAQYGLVESVAGRDAIVRILLTAPEESDGDVEGLRTRRIEPIALEEAALLPPVRPSKIVCVGRNYREHAAELGTRSAARSRCYFSSQRRRCWRRVAWCGGRRFRSASIMKASCAW